MKEYLTSDTIEELLRELFENTDLTQPSPERIRADYLRPFAILLCAGYGRMIRHFVDVDSLQDLRLPFSSNEDFPRTTKVDLCQVFFKEQWLFSVAQLVFDMSNKFENDRILPIVSKREIGNGGSAILYEITVDAAYNKLVPTRHDQVSSWTSSWVSALC